MSPQGGADLTHVYDAIVVGSGAAGGMAAHVLTAHGMDVLLLEAGKKLDIDKELRSMEWPYDHARRGDLPPGSHGLTFNEYTVRQPPYARGQKYKHVYSYVGGWTGADYAKEGTSEPRLLQMLVGLEKVAVIKMARARIETRNRSL